KQATTILEITTIKQGTKTTEEHVQLFKQCYMQSGYGEIVGIHKFKRSLNTPLLEKLMAVPELPVTLERWYELAVHLDRQWRQAVAERKIFTTHSEKVEGGSSNTPRQTQPSQPATRPPVPPVRNTWQGRDPNRCYNCGQLSHFAWNC
ncbi:hypothetical protein AMATHDRAFT_117014, partial [Amanita thiersii Skay4041]